MVDRQMAMKGPTEGTSSAPITTELENLFDITITFLNGRVVTYRTDIAFADLLVGLMGEGVSANARVWFYHHLPDGSLVTTGFSNSSVQTVD